ncbi:MAG: hypothetical protein GY940_06905 [bacterium]|nr:hypothetical protein [bacterium]
MIRKRQSVSLKVLLVLSVLLLQGALVMAEHGNVWIDVEFWAPKPPDSKLGKIRIGGTVSYFPKNGPVGFGFNLTSSRSGEDGQGLIRITPLSLNIIWRIPLNEKIKLDLSAGSTYYLFSINRDTTGSMEQEHSSLGGNVKLSVDFWPFPKIYNDIFLYAALAHYSSVDTSGREKIKRWTYSVGFKFSL